MLDKLSKVFRNSGPVLTCLGAGMLVLIVMAFAFAQQRGAAKQNPAQAQSAVRWDEAASKSLESEYHKLHNSWNALDVKSLKNMLVGDDVLATFDLDPDTSEPVKLTSKLDMDKFTDKIFEGFKSSNIKVLAQHPMIKCRATSDFGACTEECRVQLFLPNGQKQVQLLRASAIAVKYTDGWKFIQWHMSKAGPLQTFDKDGNLLASK
jgi:hypothetical protein